MNCCLPGTHIRDSMPKAFTGAGPVGTLWWHASTFQAPRRKAGAPHPCVVCTNSLGAGIPTYQGTVGTFPPEIHVPRCQPRATVPADLSKENSPRPAVLPLCCTPNLRSDIPDFSVFSSSEVSPWVQPTGKGKGLHQDVNLRHSPRQGVALPFSSVFSIFSQ